MIPLRGLYILLLQKPISNDYAVLVGECLRTLVLLHTLSKVSSCKRGFMTLLLEAVIVVFSVRQEGYSEVEFVFFSFFLFINRGASNCI